MGDGVVGGGCCGRRVLGDGVMGDGVVGGGCWGMVLWEEGVMGDGVGRWVLGDGVVGGGDGVMDNTSEPTNIFGSDFWGLFSPLPSLSNLLFLLSQLNVHVHATSPSSPLAPSDVSSPLVVMATSSSITVMGGPQLACWGSPDHDLQRAGTTDDTSDCCDRFATSNHIFGLHVHIYIHIYCWWSRGGASSHH